MKRCLAMSRRDSMKLERALRSLRTDCQCLERAGARKSMEGNARCLVPWGTRIAVLLKEPMADVDF